MSSIRSRFVTVVVAVTTVVCGTQMAASASTSKSVEADIATRIDAQEIAIEKVGKDIQYQITVMAFFRYGDWGIRPDDAKNGLNELQNYLVKERAGLKSVTANKIRVLKIDDRYLALAPKLISTGTNFEVCVRKTPSAELKKCIPTYRAYESLLSARDDLVRGWWPELEKAGLVSSGSSPGE